MFFPPLLRQRSHHALERDQGNSVCGKGPQEAWQKAPPVRSGPAFSAHSHRGFPPVAELSAVKVVRHDALLNDVGGVTRDPEYLCADAAGPEIDGGSRELGVSLEKAGEDVVRAPHEEKEGAKQKSGAEAVIEAADSMIFELVLEGVSWCKEKKLSGGLKVPHTSLFVQSIGPLYFIPSVLPRALYWICSRDLTCSTGAAMKLTVQPANTPAIPWPMVGRASLFGYTFFLSRAR